MLDSAFIRLYIIRDLHTRQQVGGTYKSYRRACRRRDVLDNQYGAYRYAVITVS